MYAKGSASSVRKINRENIKKACLAGWLSRSGPSARSCLRSGPDTYIAESRVRVLIVRVRIDVDRIWVEDDRIWVEVIRLRIVIDRL